MRLEKADAFREDFALRALWYVRQADEDVARRFQQALDATLRLMHGARDLPRRLAEPPGPAT